MEKSFGKSADSESTALKDGDESLTSGLKTDTLPASVLIAARDKWMRAASNTNPVDKPAAEEVMSKLYIALERKPPIFVWVDSPMTQLVAAAGLASRFYLGLPDSEILIDRAQWRDLFKPVWENAYFNLHLEASPLADTSRKVYDFFDQQLAPSLDFSLSRTVNNQLWDQERTIVSRSNEWQSLIASASRSLKDSLEKAGLNGYPMQESTRFLADALITMSTRNMPDFFSYTLGQAFFKGYEGSAAVISYKLMEDHFGIMTNAHKKHLLDLYCRRMETCDWAMTFDKICFLSHRPLAVKWSDDPVPVLHCEDGPAVAYRDGTRLYSWRGTDIPKSWIENPETLSAAGALAENNAERRRAACEILGWDKILAELYAEVIDEDENPQVGILLRADLPQAIGSQFLKVECGTGRTFVIPVPETMRTAIAANAWTYGLTIDEYKQLEIRT